MFQAKAGYFLQCIPLIKYFELLLENVLDQRINVTSESLNYDSYFYILSML